MIKVGIHDNLVLHKTTKNDKGTLVVGVKTAPEGGLLAGLDDARTDSAGGGEENDFLFFPPQATNRENQTDTPENNMNKVKELKDQLTAILLNYMPSDKIKWDTLKGTGITQENINVKLEKQETLNIMYDNIVEQFISMMTPYVNRNDLKFRWLFVRSSKTKHFAALRKRYLTEQPFMEPMIVPKTASKLKYTKWEIDNGFNNPDRIEQAVAEVNTDEQADLARQAFNS